MLTVSNTNRHVRTRAGRLQAYGHAFTFLTRNLARIAPDLVACLKEHDQSLDPNLVQLADAYSVVLAKLGPEALAKSEAAAAETGQEGSGDDEDDDEAAAEEAVLLADDIGEGLSSVAAGQVAASGAAVPKGRSSGRYVYRGVAMLCTEACTEALQWRVPKRCNGVYQGVAMCTEALQC